MHLRLSTLLQSRAVPYALYTDNNNDVLLTKNLVNHLVKCPRSARTGRRRRRSAAAALNIQLAINSQGAAAARRTHTEEEEEYLQTSTATTFGAVAGGSVTTHARRTTDCHLAPNDNRSSSATLGTAHLTPFLLFTN